MPSHMFVCATSLLSFQLSPPVLLRHSHQAHQKLVKGFHGCWEPSLERELQKARTRARKKRKRLEHNKKEKRGKEEFGRTHALPLSLHREHRCHEWAAWTRPSLSGRSGTQAPWCPLPPRQLQRANHGGQNECGQAKSGHSSCRNKRPQQRHTRTQETGRRTDRQTFGRLHRKALGGGIGGDTLACYLSVDSLPLGAKSAHDVAHQQFPLHSLPHGGLTGASFHAQGRASRIRDGGREWERRMLQQKRKVRLCLMIVFLVRRGKKGD